MSTFQGILLVSAGHPEFTQVNGSSVVITPATLPFPRSILGVYARLTTSAVVGNRTVLVQVTDNASGLFLVRVPAGVVQAASQTNRHYSFAPSLTDLTAFRTTAFLTTPLPSDLYIPPTGVSLSVYDFGAVDTTGDSLLVSVRFGY